MESSIYDNIIWHDSVYNSKKTVEQIIVNAKNISQEKIDEMAKKDDKELSSILLLRKYMPRTIDIVVWPLIDKHKIMFKFLNDGFSWNEYNIEFTWENYHNKLNDIGDAIIKEFSILYNHVNFITYIESMKYWVDKHSYILSI